MSQAVLVPVPERGEGKTTGEMIEWTLVRDGSRQWQDLHASFRVNVDVLRVVPAGYDGGRDRVAVTAGRAGNAPAG